IPDARKIKKIRRRAVDNGNIGEEKLKGLYVREVMACDHVGINYLVKTNTRNFFLQKSGYIVFEQDVCKVVCPACLIKAL
ncbi:MAG: hypothetical protein WBE58_23945, partial [Verrucomicrobiales bacterium]